MAGIIKLSPRQIILLLVISRLTTAYTYLPGVSAPPANQDVWIAALLSILYGFVLCGPLLFLSNKFESMTVFEYTEKVTGRIAGKLLGLLLVFQLIWFSLTQLPLLSTFMRSSVMPETPDFAFMLGLVSVCVYTAYKGAAVICRLAEILVPLILLSILVLSLLNLRNMEFEVLLPVLTDSSFLDINIGAFGAASRHFDIIALAMLAPYLDRKGELNRIFSYYIGICTFFFLIIIITTQTVLGLELAVKANFPFYLCSQIIDVFDIFERIESINAVSWFFGVFLKCSLYLYLASAGMAQVFKAKSYKPFIIPIALFELVIALKSPIINFNVMSRIFSYKIAPFTILPGMLIIPLVVLIVYLCRRKSLDHAINENT